MLFVDTSIQVLDRTSVPQETSPQRQLYSLVFHTVNNATIKSNTATSLRLRESSKSSRRGISLQSLVQSALKLPSDLPRPSFSFSLKGRLRLSCLLTQPPSFTLALLSFAEAQDRPPLLPAAPPFMLVILGLAARTLPCDISALRPGEDQPPPRRGDGERERDMRSASLCSTKKGVVGWRGLFVVDVDEAPCVRWIA